MITAFFCAPGALSIQSHLNLERWGSYHPLHFLDGESKSQGGDVAWPGLSEAFNGAVFAAWDLAAFTPGASLWIWKEVAGTLKGSGGLFLRIRPYFSGFSKTILLFYETEKQV